jgi:hypothetical protein
MSIILESTLNMKNTSGRRHHPPKATLSRFKSPLPDKRKRTPLRLGTYPYKAGIKFMLQPQNNHAFDSPLLGYLFLFQRAYGVFS